MNKRLLSRIAEEFAWLAVTSPEDVQRLAPTFTPAYMNPATAWHRLEGSPSLQAYATAFEPESK